jgi:hypothetical protein
MLKMKSPSFEWKRIVKSLNAIEFIIKNGNMNMLGKIQMEGGGMLNNLTGFSFDENGVERGRTIRDKATLIYDLLNNKHKLELERA